MEERQTPNENGYTGLYRRLTKRIKTYVASPTDIQPVFRQPGPQNAGYVLVLAVGTGIAVMGALLPAHLSWWWLDKAGHVAGGLTLMLGLLILVDAKYAFAGVVFLSIFWEAIEWTVGSPFLVTSTDTKLDLLAGWLGAIVGYLGIKLSQSLQPTLARPQN